MSAETLRKAAALMRERAEKARTGDTIPGDFWHHDLTWMSKRFEVIATGEGSIIAEGLDRWTAEHIAGFGPAVALAVADWLWETANLIEVHAGTECAEPCLHPTCRVIDRALAVARAYLGEAS